LRLWLVEAPFGLFLLGARGPGGRSGGPGAFYFPAFDPRFVGM
jgi:hypothetical protein